MPPVADAVRLVDDDEPAGGGEPGKLFGPEPRVLQPFGTDQQDVDLAGDGVATIDMTLTSAACPLTDVIEDQAASALEGLVTDFRINWVWLPPWGPDKITEDGREQLRALGFNV